MLDFTLETDSEVVLLAFRPLLIPIYEALELSVPKAIQIVAENDWESSGHLTSHLIRAEAKKFLKDRPCPIEIDDIPRTVNMERIAMEGLSTTFEGVKVKILKGAEIPKATTDPRRAFYQHANPGLWVSGVVPPIRSLIVLWDCNKAGTNLGLQLCCTRDGEGKDQWMIPVPHPAHWMVALNATTPTVDNLDDLFEESKDKESER